MFSFFMKPGAMMTSVNKRTYWTSRLKTWILDSKSRFESNLRLDFESKNHINLRSWATYSRRWPSYYQCRQFCYEWSLWKFSIIKVAVILAMSIKLHFVQLCKIWAKSDNLHFSLFQWGPPFANLWICS